MNGFGQCRCCGGVYRLADSGDFLRPHGKQRYRCKGWRQPPVDTAVRQNAVSRFSAFGKI